MTERGIITVWRSSSNSDIKELELFLLSGGADRMIGREVVGSSNTSRIAAPEWSYHYRVNVV